MRAAPGRRGCARCLLPLNARHGEPEQGAVSCSGGRAEVHLEQCRPDNALASLWSWQWLVMEACGGGGGGDADPTAELMTQTKFRWRTSAAGHSRPVPKFPRSRGKEPSNRDERQPGCRKSCVCREWRAGLPSATLLSDAPCRVTNQPPPQNVIRRTPATEPFKGHQGVLQILAGLARRRSRQAQGCPASCTDEDWSCVGSCVA